MDDFFIGMRAKDAEVVFRKLADEAAQAIGRDGAFDWRMVAESNDDNTQVITIHFNNDDMERPEMDGRTIVDWE